MSEFTEVRTDQLCGDCGALLGVEAHADDCTAEPGHTTYPDGPDSPADQFAAPEPCLKCGGTGEYKWGGAVENGVFTGNRGMCFACRGKGFQTPADVKRNEVYWTEYANTIAF